MSLQDKILKRKLKKKEKQKLKIIEDRKSNTNNDFVETEMSSEEKVEVFESDVENQGLKRKHDESTEDPETPIKNPKKKKKSELGFFQECFFASLVKNKFEFKNIFTFDLF